MSLPALLQRVRKWRRYWEGKPVCLLSDGRIEYENYRNVGLPYDKFFAELRLKSIDHLGQVRKAYLETSGEISVYLFEDENVREGLPIYPEAISGAIEDGTDGKDNACIYCGNVQTLKRAISQCSVCQKNKWLLPSSSKRVQ